MLLVVHAFCTIGATVTGVIGKLITEQLHLDLVPGTAAISYGKLGDGDTH